MGIWLELSAGTRGKEGMLETILLSACFEGGVPHENRTDSGREGEREVTLKEDDGATSLETSG